MDIGSTDSPGLERQLAEALRQILIGVPWLRGWSVRTAPPGDRVWDVIASGPIRGAARATLCVECKSHSFQPSQFSSLSQRTCRAQRAGTSAKVLAMPRVSPRMAALCLDQGWSWCDLSGNCRLEIPGALLIERTGNAPVRRPRASGASLSTPETGRIVRALLAPENAGQRWTQRGMVDHFSNVVPRVAAPSLALVNKVVQHLRAQAFLESLPNRGFRVRDPVGLLQAWRDAYRFARHPRRGYFTLLQGNTFLERLRNFDAKRPGHFAYAAFSAADLQAPAVRQPRTWLYLDPSVEHEFQDAIEAKVVESGENVVVLIADDDGVFYRLEAGKGRPSCTNAAQTYVDVAHAGGRGEEAAAALLQQRLSPVWKAASR